MTAEPILGIALSMSIVISGVLIYFLLVRIKDIEEFIRDVHNTDVDHKKEEPAQLEEPPMIKELIKE